VVWGQVSAGVVRDIEGRPLYFVGHVEDITERKRLEQDREAARADAERQAEKLNRIIEAMTDGVLVYDEWGRTTLTNLAVRRMLGLDGAPPTFSELTGDARIALFQTRNAQGHPLAPDELPSRRALRGEVLTGANAVELTSHTFDGREVSSNVSAAPLRGPDGAIAGAVSIVRDVTEHKRLERARAEQAEQLDRVFEAMADAVFVYDSHGRTLRTNTAARQLLGLDFAPPDIFTMPGYVRVSLVQMRDAKGHPFAPDDIPSMRAVRGEVLTGANAVDITALTFDGREIESSVSAAPLRDAAGNIVGGVMILRDRTEHNRLQREREEARASELAAREMTLRLETFSQIAEHDLKQPTAISKLAVQKALLELLEAARSVPSASGKYTLLFARVAAELERADQSLVRLWRLVEQLLDASQARHGTLRLDRQPCSLDDLVRQGVKEQQQLVPARVLTLHLPASLPVMVHADATRLSQVINNFLSNAVRYSPETQPIAVTLRVVGEGAGATARVEVRDSGPGIAPEDREKIWVRFQQARTVSESGGGLGLGLYIAKLIAEGHGGTVEVESEVGRGSTFSFTVPLTPAAELPFDGPPSE
jgi:PAS domain S-box-containing protein